MTAHNNLRWASLLVEECVRQGVTVFYAAPGSRSTPLVMAVARHPKAHLFMHVDERATAFMALGYGRATDRPAAWITTSGTALAHGFPAVIEASQEAVPMLLLTADRPPELRDTDANQTIRQDHLFGAYVRWFVDIPTPSDEIKPTWLLSTIDEAIHRARSGPVHLNCMYRKPLVPEPSDTPPGHDVWNDSAFASDDPAWQRWVHGSAPYTRMLASDSCNEAVLEELRTRLQAASRPFVVFGRLRGDVRELQAAARAFMDRYPVVGAADIGSQLRLGGVDALLLPSMDALLYGNALDGLEPDLILQFGATPVSRRLQEWAPGAERIVIDHRPRRIDPEHRGGWRLDGDAIAVLKGMTARSDVRDSHDASPWQQAWLPVHQAVQSWLADDLGEALTEQRAAHELTLRLRATDAFVVASSNPVRHADQFAGVDGDLVPVSANRGASGIDGTLATAAGFADGSNRRPVILVGDLALQHDMTSLALCAQRKAVVVVINNDGGGIFSYLPVREHTELFETWFGTPHGQDFASAARQFSMGYHQPETLEAFRSVLDAALAGDEAIVIEVCTDRSANLMEQRRLLQALSGRVHVARS